MQWKRSRNGLLTLGLAAGLLGGGVAPLWPQATGTVQGRVTAEVTAQALGLVRIYAVENPRLEATTADDGRYTIRNMPAGTYTLRASMLGFSRLETAVSVAAGQTVTADFVLRRAVISLDEVVVTGTAGAQERRTLGNAVGAISVAEIEAAPVTNAVEALTARVPGLTLMSNSGQAGSSSNIRIRGAGSLSGGYSPVFYVDGIRIESGLVEQASTYQGGTALDFLNPDDIESIEVIKGPRPRPCMARKPPTASFRSLPRRGAAGHRQPVGPPASKSGRTSGPGTWGPTPRTTGARVPRLSPT